MSNVSPDEPITKANLLRHLEQGWNDCQAFLASLSEEQLTGPTDAVGWTIRDHIVHLSVWEEGILALLDGRSRLEAMGVDEVTWNSDEDHVNAVIRQHYQSMPLADVLQMFRQTQERLVQKIESLKDEDLLRPYRDFQPDSSQEEPIVGWIVGNTFGHYNEHKPWMAAIVSQG